MEFINLIYFLCSKICFLLFESFFWAESSVPVYSKIIWNVLLETQLHDIAHDRSIIFYRYILI